MLCTKLGGGLEITALHHRRRGTERYMVNPRRRCAAMERATACAASVTRSVRAVAYREVLSVV